MSTRSQIRVKGSPCLVYRHMGGYPAGMLPDLMPVVARMVKGRPGDPEYMVARIVHALIAANDPEGVLSYGIDLDVHGDIEYLYEVDPKTGAIDVLAMPGEERIAKVHASMTVEEAVAECSK